MQLIQHFNPILKFISLTLLVFLAPSCGSSNGSQADEKEPKVIFTEENDSIVYKSFKIQLKLSKETEDCLTQNKESIIYSIFYKGIPKDTTMVDYINWGSIVVGEVKIEAFDSSSIKVTPKISKADFDLLVDDDIEVLINVYSGRKSSNFNLVDVEIFQDKISRIKNGKIILKGDLIRKCH